MQSWEGPLKQVADVCRSLEFNCWKEPVTRMCQATAVRRVIVSNPQGLHARPADLFVKTAMEFESRIEVTKNGEVVDGKSILSILTLAAVQGTELVIQAEGPDSEGAVEALADLFEQEFADESTAEKTSEHQQGRGTA